MDPGRAARVIATQLLGREPNDTELRWTEQVVRSVLPHDQDPTPRVPTQRGFPPPPTDALACQTPASLRKVLRSREL